MSDKIELIKGEIAVLNLEPGDRLVLTLDRVASQQELLEITKSITEWAGDIPCLVLNRNLDLRVVRGG